MVNKLTKAQEKRLRKVLVKNTRLIDGVFAIPTSLYSNVIDDIAKELSRQKKKIIEELSNWVKDNAHEVESDNPMHPRIIEYVDAIELDQAIKTIR